MAAVGAEWAGVLLKAAVENGPIRNPSVPLADDPELAEHALWNDEIAEDLEQQMRLFDEPLTRALDAAAELRRLAEMTVRSAAVYRGAIREMHASGMSYAEIGAALGISRGTVQKHMECDKRKAGVS